MDGINVSERVRKDDVSNNVSLVSSYINVRKQLVAMQQKIAGHHNVVMDGRDIGTAVFPNAELKIFMTASPEVRAQRRFDELKANGKSVSFEEVKANLVSRDKEDTSRKENPLIQAEDAIALDNSELSTEEQLELALGWVAEKVA